MEKIWNLETSFFVWNYKTNIYVLFKLNARQQLRSQLLQQVFFYSKFKFINRSILMNKIDKCTNGEVVDFDDGHIPLICKLRNFKTRIVQNQVRQASNFFSVYENAVDPA